MSPDPPVTRESRGTTTAPPSADDDASRAGAGLRLRIWIGALLGGLLGAAAVIVVAGGRARGDPLFDPMALGIWAWSAAALCLGVGIGVGLWLDHAIASQLRGLSRAVLSGDLTQLRGLPASSGWGELSDLTEQVHALIARQHEIGRAALEIEELRHRIRGLRMAVDLHGNRGETLRTVEGPLGPLVESLNRQWAQAEEERDRSREAALAARRELSQALAEARESAEQAERGFVEATALLTSLRELQRLGDELSRELPVTGGAPGAAPAAEADAFGAQRLYREAAAGAIEELVSASGQSVAHLAGGLLRVQEIADQVQALGNRATLIALNVAVGGVAPASEDLAHDLRSLAREVRAVTERTTELARGIDAEVAAAAARMQDVRGRVAARLEEAPELPEEQAPAGGVPAPAPQAGRLLERVREMVQDAAAKGERLSATGERASRAAERLLRRLDEEAAELERLATRLGAGDEEVRDSAAPADLRLLGPRDLEETREDDSAPPADGGPEAHPRDEGRGEWP